MLIQLDGTTAGIISSKNDKLRIGGWTTKYKDLRKDDLVIVRTSSGQESQYKIESVVYMTNVRDQYFMTLIFTPRERSII